MLVSLLPILLILLLLLSGYFTGKLINTRLRTFLVRQIANLVFLLLAVMGMELGPALLSFQSGINVVGKALLFASLISVVTFVLLAKFCASKKRAHKKEQKISALVKPVINCVKALSFFFIGLFLYAITHINLADYLISSSSILYLLIFFVGIDLTQASLNKKSFTNLKIPFFTILATMIAAFIFSLFTRHSFIESLMLSSGYGWFSLSGPMVTHMLGESLGSLAFMVDLFREFFSIFVLYLFGRNYPSSGIGVSGAAALDSALPFIKENCTENDVQDAIVSGFVLTLAAPFFILFFASLLLGNMAIM